MELDVARVIKNIKIIVIFLILTLFSGKSFSNEIIGSWVIDYDATLKFNSAYSDISDTKYQLIKCMSLNMTVEVDESSFSIILDEHDCGRDGENSTIAGFQNAHEYKKVYEDDKLIILRKISKDNNSYIETIHWESPNKIWMYYPGERPYYDEHIRYYYKRK